MRMHVAPTALFALPIILLNVQSCSTWYVSIQCLFSLLCTVPKVGCSAVLGQMGWGVGIGA